jgi:hypothetical protein
MNCKKFRSLIRPYLESEVDGVLGNEFRWHKHFCDCCRSAYVAAEPSAAARHANRPTGLAHGGSGWPASDGPKPGMRAGGPLAGRRRP